MTIGHRSAGAYDQSRNSGSHPWGASAVVLGVGVAFLGYFAFALNDALAKALVVSYGVAQVVAIRSVSGFLLLTPLLIRSKSKLFSQIERPGLQLTRAILATVDTGLFYAACVYLPLADVFTFYMAGPIYTTLASYLFLREKVGWKQWVAIIIGFIGVVIALRPSSEVISFAAVFAISGSISYSLAMVINKKLERTSDAVLVSYQSFVGIIGAGALSAFDWRPVTIGGLGAMLLLGMIGTAAHLMLTRAVKLSPVSLLAPIQYTLLLWGIIFGFMFFGDYPSATTILGSGIIVAAGLLIFYRKSKSVDRMDPQLPLDVP
ncbi:DMT family transporter|uniref:DMT family transporter n=1 Tax=Rhizobium altiplani TaxID=1864509 RepID=UPI0009EB8AF6|nr:DMT family transporter [Rhizobium altiplani]